MDQHAPFDNGPAYAPAPRGSSWPVTFGVLGIVFGIFGLISSLWGIASMVMFANMSTLMGAAATLSPPAPGSWTGGTPTPSPDPDEMVQTMMEGYERWAGAGIILQGLSFLLAILLLIGGIQLINRKPIAPKLLQIWAYGKIVVGIGASLIGYLMQSGQMRAMQETMGSAIASSPTGGPSTPMPAAFGSAFELVAGATFFLGVIWVCILPVVFLIWLNRAVVKADIATWPRS